MDGDGTMLNSLARTYDTNFMLHLGGDLNVNPQKKHIARELQALLEFDPVKLVCGRSAK